MKLYGYWRSSSTWRVRIALAYKGINYESVPVHLVKGEQHYNELVIKNPMGQVPVLEVEVDKRLIHLSQSAAILQYLEETHPEPSLTPSSPLLRAQMRQVQELVNSGIQPLQNFSVLQHVREKLAHDPKQWAQHWIATGLQATVSKLAGRYAIGDNLSLADLYIVPQLYNARRFDVPLDAYPVLLRIEKQCESLPAFIAAHPSQQIDAPRDA
jgi:maleylpyruvate isomerase